MNDNKYPVHTSTFKTSLKVVCGKCNGTGSAEEETCPLCGGEGILERATEGTVSLFRVNELDKKPKFHLIKKRWLKRETKKC